MAGNFRLYCLSVLVAVCFLSPPSAHSQETESPVMADAPTATNTAVGTDTTPLPDNVVTTTKPPVKKPVESEIAAAGMVTYGNYKIFGAAARANIWSAGVEYDRHSWGYFVKAQMDWVVEVLPFVILSEPLKADFYGNPMSPYQQLIPGFGISPCCFRAMWRSNARVKPFLIGKAGVIAFPKKILSSAGSYANFNFQGDFGLQIRMTDRMDLRVDPLVYFHVSNGYFAASNPGFDQLGAKFGISYHLGKQAR